MAVIVEVLMNLKGKPNLAALQHCCNQFDVGQWRAAGTPTPTRALGGPGPMILYDEV